MRRRLRFAAASGAGGLSPFSVVIARGRHLFPFRTEQLSPTAPMVLGPKGPGRVGRRRFFLVTGAAPSGRLFVVVGAGSGGRARRGHARPPCAAGGAEA